MEATPEHIRLSGKTGSNWRSDKTSILTRLGHGPSPIAVRHALIGRGEFSASGAYFDERSGGTAAGGRAGGRCGGLLPPHWARRGKHPRPAEGRGKNPFRSPHRRPSPTDRQDYPS